MISPFLPFPDVFGMERGYVEHIGFRVHSANYRYLVAIARSPADQRASFPSEHKVRDVRFPKSDFARSSSLFFDTLTIISGVGGYQRNALFYFAG